MGAIIGEIILIALCAAVVIGVIVTAVIRKKQGKSACGGDCGCCGGCSACKNVHKEEKK